MTQFCSLTVPLIAFHHLLSIDATTIGVFEPLRIDVGQRIWSLQLPMMGRSSAPERKLARMMNIGYPPML